MFDFYFFTIIDFTFLLFITTNNFKNIDKNFINVLYSFDDTELNKQVFFTKMIHNAFLTYLKLNFYNNRTFKKNLIINLAN